MVHIKFIIVIPVPNSTVSWFFGTPPPQGAAQTRLQWRSDPKREGNLPIVDGEIMAITGVITCYNWGYL